jgi:hypothetical protein
MALNHRRLQSIGGEGEGYENLLLVPMTLKVALLYQLM